MYPQNILVTITNLYLFLALITVRCFGESMDKIQKKAVRTITCSNYIAYSEPLLKELNLLNVKDLFQLKILEFLFKLYHNKLPPYYNNYTCRSDLEKIETPYSKWIVLQNKITVSDNLISRRIHDQSYSLTGFNQLFFGKKEDILQNQQITK